MSIAAKKVLRKQVRGVLKKMSDEERTAQSREITSKLLNLPEYQKSQRVSVYLSRNDEVSTDEIVKNLLDSNKLCYIPKQMSDEKMEMVKLDSIQDLTALAINSFGIREVIASENREDALTSGGLDLIILPGLAFTREGHRLGKGRGYYDRYILKARQISSPILIGLAFTQQILPEIPTTETDINADIVVWPGC